MEGLHGRFNSRGGGMVIPDAEEFQEEEVWAMMKARDGSNSNSKVRKNLPAASSSASSAWRFTAAPRTFPRATPAGGGIQELPAAARVAPRQSSAPVDIPDWSKILKGQANKNLWDDACDAEDDDVRRNFKYARVNDLESDDDEDMVPPHEYLARRLARTQIAPFSMCEGVGRTLKGRDLSNLRNAILSKTGFLE